jgi:RNA polymerase sigma-70 factor (ECF subfamily)
MLLESVTFLASVASLSKPQEGWKVPDEDAVERFVAEDYGRVVAAVALACGDRQLAEDSVQDALAKAWLRQPSDAPLESLTGWITRVALNRARSTWRRRAAERRARDRLSESAVRWTPDASGFGVDLERAFAALPARQREIATLRLLLQMSTEETAAILGVSTGAVKTGLMRARQSLAVTLGRDDAEAEDVEA